MNPPSNTPIKKIIVIVVCVPVVALALYFFMFRKSGPVETVDQYGNPVNAQVVGSDLVDLLGQLNSVTLDPTLFQKQAFINLTDYSTPLPQIPRGRPNPFDDIGSGGAQYTPPPTKSH